MFGSVGFGSLIPVLFVLLVACVAGGAIWKKRNSRSADDD